MEELISGVEAGDRRRIARAITTVEAGGEEAHALLAGIHVGIGSARRIGITGPPGAGKSTLVGALVPRFRATAERVGVIAVDPTSPFSGGALLGDRVRMTNLTTDPGVFIRSMASRGAFGGLARAAWDAVDVLDASGCDPVLVETVGVGQTEIEIASLSDTTLVVLSPESGDNVQAMKAGLMEIADIFVVNKADRDGSNAMKRDLESMLELRTELHPEDAGDPESAGDPKGARRWSPPVVMTSAQRGDGVDAVIEMVAAHGAHLASRGLLAARRQTAIKRRILQILDRRTRERFWTDAREASLAVEVDRVHRKETDLISAAERVLAADDLDRKG